MDSKAKSRHPSKRLDREKSVNQTKIASGSSIISTEPLSLAEQALNEGGEVEDPGNKNQSSEPILRSVPSEGQPEAQLENTEIGGEDSPQSGLSFDKDFGEVPVASFSPAKGPETGFTEIKDRGQQADRKFIQAASNQDPSGEGTRSFIGYRSLLQARDPPLAVREKVLPPDMSTGTDLKQKLTTWDKLSRVLVVSTSNIAYQLWKIIIVCLSLSTSFIYAYISAFLARMSTDQVERIERADGFVQMAFVFDSLLHFFVEHHSLTSSEPERDLRRLFIINLKTRFVFDVITIVPLFHWFEGMIELRYRRLLYLFRVLRLVKGMKILSMKQTITQVRKWQAQRIQKLIQSNSASGQDTDHTRITYIVLFQLLLQCFHIVTVLTCLSFFAGAGWYILSDLQSGNDHGLILQNEFERKTTSQAILTLTYFSFTTFSTVGLGDIHPISNSERVMGVWVLITGVIVTSFSIENLMTKISQIRALENGYEEDEKLSLFFGTIYRFNNSLQLEPQLQGAIERYFKMRWQRNRNVAIQTASDELLLEQLPKKVQNKIFTDYLFKRFYLQHKAFFNAIDQTPETYKGFQRQFMALVPQRYVLSFFLTNYRLSLLNELYLDFIVRLMKVLEPLEVEPFEVVQKANHEIEEVLFLENGTIEVGYNNAFLLGNSTESKSLVQTVASIQSKFNNRKKFHFPVKLEAGQYPVGIFEATFEKRSQFIYRVKAGESKDVVDAFFVRIKNWKKLLSSGASKEILGSFKNVVIMGGYIEKVYTPMKLYQQEQIRAGGGGGSSRSLAIAKFQGEGERLLHKFEDHFKREFINVEVCSANSDDMQSSDGGGYMGQLPLRPSPNSLEVPTQDQDALIQVFEAHQSHSSSRNLSARFEPLPIQIVEEAEEKLANHQDVMEELLRTLYHTQNLLRLERQRANFLEGSIALDPKSRRLLKNSEYIDLKKQLQELDPSADIQFFSSSESEKTSQQIKSSSVKGKRVSFKEEDHVCSLVSFSDVSEKRNSQCSPYTPVITSKLQQPAKTLAPWSDLPEIKTQNKFESSGWGGLPSDTSSNKGPPFDSGIEEVKLEEPPPVPLADELLQQQDPVLLASKSQTSLQNAPPIAFKQNKTFEEMNQIVEEIEESKKEEEIERSNQQDSLDLSQPKTSHTKHAQESIVEDIHVADSRSVSSIEKYIRMKKRKSQFQTQVIQSSASIIENISIHTDQRPKYALPEESQKSDQDTIQEEIMQECSSAKSKEQYGEISSFHDPNFEESSSSRPLCQEEEMAPLGKRFDS